MNYVISLDNFSGPLDLLLHLIKESNINIFDIDIEIITKQYMDYINKIKELNLNVASEYLVMAAELIEMKSKTLLPSQEEEHCEEEEDPREELIKRLIEYKNYKEISPELRELEKSREEYFTKSPSLEITGIDLSPKVSDDIDFNMLMDAFNKFMLNKQLDQPLNTKIANKEYSIIKRCEEIRNMLSKKDTIRFEEIFDHVSKDYIIISFLSILTMAKNQEIILKQSNNFDELYLVRK